MKRLFTLALMLFSLKMYSQSPSVYFFDADGDGYGNPQLSILAINPPPGYVSNNSDCNDNNASAYPGATEVQNSLDDNCDGQVDEGLIGFNQFIFLKGNTTDYRYGSYGTQGVASVSNNPGKRSLVTNWEASDKIYLFGGEGAGEQLSSPGGNPAPPVGYLNDLWEYNTKTNLWTWLKGSKTLGSAPVTGTQGMGAAANTPGARKNGASWLLNGKLYLFGGYITYTSQGRVNDLWEYDPANNNWKWLNGTPTSSNIAPVYGTQGVFDAANNPGGREDVVTWVYNNKLYLFGGIRGITGIGDVSMSDVWEYDPAINQWRWISGPSTYNNTSVAGTPGVADAANYPGGRFQTDAKLIGDKLYLFAGWGYATGFYHRDDLWEFDHATGYWRLLKGGVENAARTTGTPGTYAPANTPGARHGHKLSVHNNTIYLYGGNTFNAPSGILNDLWQYDPILNQWRYVKGTTTVNSTGNYGLKETEAAVNLPAARKNHVLSGIGNNLYLFGGRGYTGITSAEDYQNDIWRFNTTTGNWRWQNGPSGKERFGEYGTAGIESSGNKPGDRVGHALANANGRVYLFGGNAKRLYNNEGGSNDLWEYNPVTNNWKFLKGSSGILIPENYGTQGVPAFSNMPGARFWHVMWSLNNKVYMFGGQTGGFKNDLWEYNPAANNWTWLKGSTASDQPGVYGTKGVAAPANNPGARIQAGGCVYNNKLYLFGGEGYNSGSTRGLLNDLWEYDPATNNWTWLAGDDAINVFGVYGTTGVADAANKPGSRVDMNIEAINGSIYMFGNLGYGSSGGVTLRNDLWKYDLSTNLWTFVKGSNTGTAPASTGSLGVESPTNMPGGRTGASGYTIGGKLYIFGGTPFSNSYNDLWEYNPVTNNWRWIKGPGNLSNQRGNYGLTGVAATTNNPPARKNMKTTVIGNTVYFFGGNGQYATNIGENFNDCADLWKWNGDNPVLSALTRLYVNDNSLMGDIYTTATGNDNNPGTPAAPLATLDYAVLIADAGDTIYVDAGTYITPNITIGKALTIFGPNSDTSPNDENNPLLYNTGRNEEATISGSTITIGSSNINIAGLSFEPGSKVQIQQSNNTLDYSNIKISGNRFLISSNFFVIALTGRNITPLSSNNYFIHNNRFEKTSGTSGTTVNLNYINLAHITGNVFTISNSSLARIQSAFSIGTTGKTDNLTITGNIFDRYNGTVSTIRFGTTLIDGNKLYDCQSGFLLSNSISEPAVISVTGNILNNIRSTPVSFNRTSTNDNSSPNKFICEDNTVTLDATGQIPLASAVFLSTVQASTVLSADIETSIKRNMINYTGDFTASPNFSLLGIRIAGRHTNILIDSNEIIMSGTNLSQSLASNSTGVSIFTNATGAGTGQIPANAVINILHNKINGFKQSVTFNNVQTGQFGGLLNATNINENSFTNDSISINNGTFSQAINASCNWYSAITAQAIAAKVTPSTVDYAPWLTNGTDNDFATGFQPVSGSCNGTPPVATLDAFTNVTCFGSNNGTISVSVSGGTTPYSFAWTKDEDPLFSSSSEDLTNLEPGTYYLVVTDANGSLTSQLEVTINEPELLQAFAYGTNNLCYGDAAGTAFVVVFGGTAPYSYNWSNGATTEDITALPAGVYTVTVADANGCAALAQYEVTQPAQLVAVITNTSTACANSATVTVTGGTGGYDYLWSNGSTTNSISNVPAGTYNVTVTDENGCSVTESITLTVNEGFNPSAAVTGVSCFGGNNGTITVTNANGTAPFQYSIDGFTYQSSNIFNGLVAGTYTITVVDANGCTGFVTKTITQPTQLTITLNSVNKTCFGLSTGSVNLTVSGGSPAYSYLWSGPGGYSSTQLNSSNLAEGNYTLTVTDNKGCVAVQPVTVLSYDQVVVAETVTNVLCKGESTGAINLTVSGGTNTSFSYLWNNGSTAEDRTNLGVGNYSVTITDNGSGCTLVRNFSITQPATSVNLSTSKTNATGCNSLGTITVTGSGGTPGYTYSINGTDYQASNTFNGLYAGTYTVWVKDANGCTKSAVVSITDNGSDEFEGNNSKNQAKTITIGADISARLALATDVADWFKFTPTIGGSYTITLNHPSVSYTFNLYPAGNNAPALVPVSTTANSKEYVLNGATTYYLSVTTTTLSYVCYRISIANTSPLITSAVKTEENKKPVTEAVNSLIASVFPNPHKGRFNIVIDSPEEGNGVIQLMGADGKLINNRNIVLRKGKGNIVEYNNINQNILFYRVIINQKSVTGKIIGPN